MSQRPGGARHARQRAGRLARPSRATLLSGNSPAPVALPMRRPAFDPAWASPCQAGRREVTLPPTPCYWPYYWPVAPVSVTAASAAAGGDRIRLLVA